MSDFSGSENFFKKYFLILIWFFLKSGFFGQALSTNHQQRLQKLDKLTPGDFATVLRQTYIWDEMPTASALLKQLEKECALKNTNKKQNSIGFI